MRMVARWLRRIVGTLLIIFLLCLISGRFLPVASTLMIGRWLTGGEVSRAWVPLASISPHLARAVIASEDQRFCSHWGVDFVELRDVLEQEGGPSRGASTITMQVAKNLWLWPGRSFLRKALEMPLALVIDLAWGKYRVMEIYLNIAEWGEGIYGAEAAARAHFGKSASALSPAEAARLASALPNPLERDASQPSANARRIAGRAAGIGEFARCVAG